MPLRQCLSLPLNYWTGDRNLPRLLHGGLEEACLAYRYGAGGEHDAGLLGGGGGMTHGTGELFLGEAARDEVACDGEDAVRETWEKVVEGIHDNDGDDDVDGDTPAGVDEEVGKASSLVDVGASCHRVPWFVDDDWAEDHRRHCLHYCCSCSKYWGEEDHLCDVTRQAIRRPAGARPATPMYPGCVCAQDSLHHLHRHPCRPRHRWDCHHPPCHRHRYALLLLADGGGCWHHRRPHRPGTVPPGWPVH